MQDQSQTTYTCAAPFSPTVSLPLCSCHIYEWVTNYHIFYESRTMTYQTSHKLKTHVLRALLTRGVADTLLVSHIRRSHELLHIRRVTHYAIQYESQAIHICGWVLCALLTRAVAHTPLAPHTNESRGMIFYESRTMTYQIETCVDGCYAFFSLVVCRWHSARATHTNESQSRTYCSTSHELWHFRRVTNTSHKHLRQFPYLTTLLVLMHSVYSPLNTSVSSAKEPYVCKALL